MNADTTFRKRLDRFPHVHGTAPEPVKLGDDKHITLFKAVEESSEAPSLGGGDRTREAARPPPRTKSGDGGQPIRPSWQAAGGGLTKGASPARRALEGR